MTREGARPQSPGVAPQEHRLRVTRTARFFSLGQWSSHVTDLWIACHGYGQLAGTFAQQFAPLLAPQRLVIAPEGLNHYYINHAERSVGATWMTSEDRLAQIDDYVHYLDELLQHVTGQLGGAVARLRVLGFSQGVHTVARWIALGTARPSAFIAWGSPLPSDLDLRRLSAKLDAALVLVHGSRDQYMTETALARERERLTAAGIAVRALRFDGGHRLDDQTLRDLAAE